MDPLDVFLQKLQVGKGDVAMRTWEEVRGRFYVDTHRKHWPVKKVVLYKVLEGI